MSGICEKCETKEAARGVLEAEVERLSTELTSTRQTIVRLHDREEKMKERLLEMKLCDEQIRISSTGSSVWVSQATDHGGGLSSINITHTDPATSRSQHVTFTNQISVGWSVSVHLSLLSLKWSIILDIKVGGGEDGGWLRGAVQPGQAGHAGRAGQDDGAQAGGGAQEQAALLNHRGELLAWQRGNMLLP